MYQLLCQQDAGFAQLTHNVTSVQDTSRIPKWHRSGGPDIFSDTGISWGLWEGQD